MENHMCRLPGDDPENTCNFCKNQFHSREEKRKHICQHHRFKTVEQQRVGRKVVLTQSVTMVPTAGEQNVACAGLNTLSQ